VGVLRKLFGGKKRPPSGVIPTIEGLGGTVRGVVHVGANTGQEARSYDRGGVKAAIYIEPLDEAFATLAERLKAIGPHHVPIKALCAEEDGRIVDFHVASNGGAASSILDFGWSREEHPEVHWTGHRKLATRRLDTVLSDLPAATLASIDLLVMDTQGTELRVLEGAPLLIDRVGWIFTEVNEGGLYEGDCSFEQLYAYLTARRFRLKQLKMNRHRWGDALFAKARD
jgi:FkbM family methyltransferase